MPESRPPIELEGLSLDELQKLMDERRLPPVERWNPERCGHSGMRIARDGTWYHQGTPIGRPAMVRLFSTVLRREPDGGWYMEMQELGYNYRLPDFNCALGLSQLARADEGLARRRQLAARYDAAFAQVPGVQVLAHQLARDRVERLGDLAVPVAGDLRGREHRHVIDLDRRGEQQRPLCFGEVLGRPLRGTYTGYGKRLPSDRPPVLTPKELALAASESNGSNGSSSPAINGSGQALGYNPNGSSGELPGSPATGDE